MPPRSVAAELPGTGTARVLCRHTASLSRRESSRRAREVRRDNFSRDLNATPSRPRLHPVSRFWRAAPVFFFPLRAPWPVRPRAEPPRWNRPCTCWDPHILHGQTRAISQGRTLTRSRCCSLRTYIGCFSHCPSEESAPCQGGNTPPKMTLCHAAGRAQTAVHARAHPCRSRVLLRRSRHCRRDGAPGLLPKHRERIPSRSGAADSAPQASS